MFLHFPRVLCAAGHHHEMGPRGSRESISAMLPEFDIKFTQNEFDLIELAREGGYDLILMNCTRLDGRYVRACNIIRMFDSKTPVLFITNSPGITEEEAESVGAQAVFSTGSERFLDDVRQRASELVGSNGLISERERI
jgi:hypothetical protein